MINVYAEKHEKIIKKTVDAALKKFGIRPVDVDAEITLVDEEEISPRAPPGNWCGSLRR